MEEQLLQMAINLWISDSKSAAPGRRNQALQDFDIARRYGAEQVPLIFAASLATRLSANQILEILEKRAAQVEKHIAKSKEKN